MAIVGNGKEGTPGGQGFDPGPFMNEKEICIYMHDWLLFPSLTTIICEIIFCDWTNDMHESIMKHDAQGSIIIE